MELIFQADFGSAGAELGYDLTASQQQICHVEKNYSSLYLLTATV